MAVGYDYWYLLLNQTLPLAPAAQAAGVTRAGKISAMQIVVNDERWPLPLSKMLIFVAPADQNLFLMTITKYILRLVHLFTTSRSFALIICIAGLQLPLTLKAQQITLTLSRQPIEKVFAAIQQQTGTTFWYSRKALQLARPVTMAINHANLTEALNECFKDQPLTWEIINGTVVVKMLTLADSGKTISGTIYSSSGRLPGVSVVIKNSDQGVTSDQNGLYSLADIPADAVLEFSSVGYEPVEKPVGNKAVIDVLMTVRSSKLDEAVVIGYGTTTRRLNTGSVSKITEEDIRKSPVSNPLSALQGRIAGIYITQQTGSPGGSFTVRLRGQNSIASGNDPLYIIDGVPYSSAPIAANSTSGLITRMGNPLSNIDPGQIQSLEVLKDADATAIYGSRGANGVILITTKRGIAGKTTVDIQVSKGVGNVTRKMKLLNAREYLDMRYEAFRNDNASPQSYDYDLSYWDTTRSTDWQKELLGGTADIWNANASIGGGSETTQFLLSAGYYQESTVFPGNFADRKVSSHMQLNHHSNDRRFTLNFSGNFSADDNKLPSTDLTTQALTLPPVAPPVYDSSGKLNWANSTWPGGNPLAFLLQKYGANTSNLVASTQLSYEIFKKCFIKTSAGYTSTEIKELSISPAGSYDPAYGIINGSSIFAENQVRSWIIEPQATYSKSLGKGELSVLAGGTFQQQITDGNSLLATGYIDDALLENIKAAPSITPIDANYVKYHYAAVFGRINYEHQHKYIANLTGRRDGSSRFGPGRQFANFAALGGAWIFSKTAFIQHAVKVLSFGKLRFSYGTTGNDQTQDYGFLDIYVPTFYGYNGGLGLFPGQLFNPNYAWEKNRKWEASLELGFFNDRLLFNASYYNHQSSNQLVGYPLAPTAGFSSVAYNLPAVVDNTGLEMELNARLLSGKSIQWTSTFNLTIPRNRLVAYPGLAQSAYANVYAIGESLFMRKKLLSMGVDATTGTYGFQDADHDGVASYPGDLQVSRPIAQNFYGGWQHEVTVGAFSVDFLFQFVKQTGRAYASGFFSTPGFPINQPTSVLQRWQKPGDRAGIQQFTQTYGAAYQQYTTSQYYGNNIIGDASFIRLKNIVLSYSIKNDILKRCGLRSFRFIVKGQNMATFTKYVGPDPENQTIAFSSPLRVITGGVQLTF